MMVEKEAILGEIVGIVKYLADRRPKGEGIYPYEIMSWLSVDRSEWSIRRYMRELVAREVIKRLGYRKGYGL